MFSNYLFVASRYFMIAFCLFFSLFSAKSLAVVSKYNREVFVVPEGTPFDSWTFGICTEGVSNKDFLPKIIRSIRELNIPYYEIIFATENRDLRIDEPDVRVLLIESNKRSHITLKKNRIAEVSRYPNLCLMHDYIYPEANWYRGFQNFGYNWSVCSTSFLNPDGTHSYEWTHYQGPYQHKNVPAHWKASINSYVPGNYFCVKKEFLIHFPLDENLILSDAEDVAWSRSIYPHWNYVFNPESFVRSLIAKPSVRPIWAAR